MGNKKTILIVTGCILASALLLIASFSFAAQLNKKKAPAYDEILQYFYQNKVDKYTLDLGRGQLSLQLKGEDQEGKTVSCTLPDVNRFLEDTMSFVRDHNINYPQDPIEVDYVAIR